MNELKTDQDKFVFKSDMIRPKGSLLGGPKMKLNN